MNSTPRKALTLRQPWASLVTHNIKGYETRGWRTDYRGPLYIHAASAKPDRMDLEQHRAVLTAHGLDPFDLPRGVILARVELLAIGKVVQHSERTGCPVIRLEGSGHIEVIQQEEERSGDYSIGRQAWKLSRPHRLPHPIPATGGDWIWTIPDFIDLGETT